MSWPKLPLDQLGYVSRGRSRHRPRNDPALYGGLYPFIQTGDVKHANFRITEHTATYSEAGLAQSRLWPRDTLCITIAANIADTALLAYEACFPDSVIGFIADKEKADPRFVKYYFDIIQRELQMVSQGTTQENLSQEKLLSFGIACPPVEVQRKVAEVLFAYDDLIATNQRRITLLEEAARRLYREWFVHLRFPGHESAPVKDGVPEGWQFGSLGTVIKTSSGGTPSRKRPDFYGKGVPWVKTKELNDGFLFETEEEITEAGLAASSAKVFPTGTVLLAMYGATIGMTALLAKPAATNQACCAFLVAETKGLSYYCFQWIKEIKQKLISLGMGAAQPNLSQEVIKRLEFLLPPSQVLELYNESVAPLFEQMATMCQQNRVLAQARDLLLPKLMSGQLDVSGIALPDEVAA